MDKQKLKKIRINVPQNIAGGVYSNFARISFTKEEFMIDFASLNPEEGIVVSRVFMSPGYLARFIKVLQKNINKYESKFKKKIVEAKEIEVLGFKVPTKTA
jgi:hypothetical protein